MTQSDDNISQQQFGLDELINTLQWTTNVYSQQALHTGIRN